MAQRATPPLPKVVREAYERGLTPIPQLTSKVPVFPWKKYQDPENRPSWKQVQRWATKYPTAMWAVVTGQPNGIITLDFDGPQGEATRKRLGLSPHRRTPSGGSHVDIRAPRYRVRGAARVDEERFPGMDLKAHGMVVTIYGERRGKRYRPVGRHEPYALADVSDDLRALIKRQKVGARHEVRFKLPKGFKDFTPASRILGEALQRADAGSRNDIGAWLAQQLRDERLSQGEAWDWMQRYAELIADAGDHPYTKQEAYNSLVSAFSRPPRLPRQAFYEDGIVRLEQRQMKNVEWLWKPWLAYGKLALLDGNKGRLKSTIIYSLAASTTQGGVLPFPGEPEGVARERKPAACIIFTNEEDIDDTIIPKLRAAGADLRRIRIIERRDSQTKRLIPIKLPDDLGYIEGQIRKVEQELKVPIALVTIDPVMGYISNTIHYGNDPQVREALTPLTDLLRERRIAGLALRHLNKNISLDAEHRGGGSVAFPSVARVHMLAEWHPDDESLGVLAQINNNLALKPQPRTYRAVEKTVEADGVEAETYYVMWEKAVNIRANDLLKQKDARKKDPKRQAYEDWLTEMLKSGRWVKVPKLRQEFEAAGFDKGGWRYLSETVANEMGVDKDRVQKPKGKGTAYWRWRLPQASPEVKADVS